jgi:hypothetical protein
VAGTGSVARAEVSESKGNYMPEFCYRALLYPAQRQRWNAGVCNSYHPTPHPHWPGIWAQKEAADPGEAHAAADFPLTFSKGIYTEQARANYLHLMRTKGGDGWTQEELDSATELAGVSAFNGPEGAARAYLYAATSGLPEHLARVVTFMGDVICDLPEGGGVIVNNVEPVPPIMTAAEFREHHGLPQYVAPAAVAGEPQEQQAAAKDIFEDLEFEDEPPIELKRDTPTGEESGR